MRRQIIHNRESNNLTCPSASGSAECSVRLCCWNTFPKSTFGQLRRERGPRPEESRHAAARGVALLSNNRCRAERAAELQWWRGLQQGIGRRQRRLLCREDAVKMP